jgi:hypothetical protein
LVPASYRFLAWMNVPPSSGSKNKLLTCFTLVSCLTYSTTLKMEVTCCSETSVYFQWTRRLYIPERSTLPILVQCSSMRCEGDAGSTDTKVRFLPIKGQLTPPLNK